ncbi:DUF3898 domain-containing protein [Paenibacillus sp. N3/727]|uniref:DUF3898 domain-containing protein n=1 Tax=Paenibacillus sp. N3/727 TaxID=2925845 RepID=UPI001F536CEB|nr:DUF3898 domain-containing protein [Paenibacillus sp. N3/727]UNK20918.1 DUF3898 domain-containing protein [Paenibacillus sp. N3/727]
MEVTEAASRIVEIKPEIELKFKIGDVNVKGLLADFGETIHITKLNGRYAVVIEGDHFVFDKGVSPIELLQPESFQSVADRLLNKEEFISDIPYLSDEQE